MASATPTTPKTKPQSLLPDTLPVPRLTSQTNFRTGDLNEGRRAVLSDLGRYLLVPYTDLVGLALGPLPEISQTHQALTETGVLSAVQSTPPSKSSLSEDEAFRPLGDLISKIFEQVPSPSESLSFTSRPFETPLSSRGNTSRPDAYIARRSTHPFGTGVHWLDIAIPFEFKKRNSNGDKYDNERKVIWSLHSIMREDPLRRFAFGITVEDTDMRIWCSHRGFLSVSSPINFIEEIDKVISLFYSIGSKKAEELGWDPTVQRIWPQGPNDAEIQYEFKIGGKYFTTTRELATYGADAMVGRGTRVYEATDEEGRTVAIKDSWRDKDRKHEGEILEMIFQDIRHKLGEKEETEARKYFVAIRSFEDVVIFGKTDTTLELENAPDVKWMSIKTDPPLSTSLHTSSVGLLPGSDVIPSMRRALPSANRKEIPCRVHTRTVFADVGIPLYEVRYLAESFRCISDSQHALKYMHKAGWVHRDYSVANVLQVKQEGGFIGKLTDVEYAKKANSNISHEVRTGTMQFMAVEVEQQEYLFSPADGQVFGSPTTPKPPFRMNYLHDLESQWWAIMWILLYHTDKDSLSGDLHAQLECFNKAFPPTIAHASRQTFFIAFPPRLQAYDALSTTYNARCKSVFYLALKLRDAYVAAEKSYPDVRIDEEHLETIHTEVSKAYDEAIELLKSDRIVLQPLCSAIKLEGQNLDGSPTANQGQKRKRGK